MAYSYDRREAASQNNMRVVEIPGKTRTTYKFVVYQRATGFEVILGYQTAVWDAEHEFYPSNNRLFGHVSLPGRFPTRAKATSAGRKALLNAENLEYEHGKSLPLVNRNLP